MNLVFLDTETTGLKIEDGHRVVEVAAVRCVDRKIVSSFRSYINPEREMDPGAAQVHGLTDEFLADKPTFAQKADELIEFIAGSLLHIHNAKFDQSFLDMELGRIGKPPLEDTVEEIVDTLALARRQFPAGRNSLDRLCARFGIDASKRTRHGALLDATLLAEVYLAMTRGQISLGGIGASEGRSGMGGPGRARRRSHSFDIRVVEASEEELRAHERYMRLLAGDRPGEAGGKAG